MNILVTGATGFIGSHLVRSLVKEGHHCRCLFRKTSDISKFKKLNNIEFIYGDITDENSLKGIAKGTDIVYHIAGLLGKWCRSYSELFQVNVQGVMNLIIACSSVNIQRFVHISAGGVTGSLKERCVDETYECRPSTPYERTKFKGEQMALKMSREHRIPLTVVRPSFAYGPGDLHKLGLFKIIKRGLFFFIGNGQSTVHPVYIDDLIDGIKLCANNEKAVGKLYIIGGPRPVTKEELVRVIAENLGTKTPKLRIPLWAAIMLAKIGEVLGRFFKFEPPLTYSRVNMLNKNWGLDISKARMELGYEPKIDLSEGIRRTVRWYKKNGYL